MGVEVASKARKGSTPGPAGQSHRPAPPKRAHTSAANISTISSSSKRNATAATANADRTLKTPLLTPQLQRAQQTPGAPKTPSPNYFGLIVEEDAANYGIDSDAGRHAKKNWNTEEREIPLEEDPRLENFRRQSDNNKSFRLGHGGLSRFSTEGRVPTLRTMHDTNMSDSSPDRQPRSAGGRMTSHIESSEEDEMDLDRPAESNGTSRMLNQDAPSFFDMQISASPAPETRPPMRHPLSHTDARHPRGSMPQTRVSTPVTSGAAVKPRSETLPASIDADAPKLLAVTDFADIVTSSKTDKTVDLLILDLRVAPQYATSRVKGALNLCIPTTLLKRPAFNVQKLTDTFTVPQEKMKFSSWRTASHIIAYDAASSQHKDAQSCVNTLRKFRGEGYTGEICILRGGFNTISRQQPDLIEKSATKSSRAPHGMKLTIGGPGGSLQDGGIQVAGGCEMPTAEQQPANPFFGNIRQNMDLIDGVGQMAIKRPASLTNNNLRGLPTWLRNVVDEEDEGKSVSERFLKIEKDEQKRMQHALSTKVHYGTPMPLEKIHGDAKLGKVQVAGIEKGSKNRYKDMLPFEHTRVRLQQSNDDGCDYINASHIKPHWTNRSYISAQAPVPATFGDYWRLIWEQDVRVIVMLAGEIENGQRKVHPYWKPDTYGDFKIRQLSEKRVSLDLPAPPSLLDPSRKASMPVSQLHTQRSFQRRATLALNPDDADRPTMPGAEKEPPSCIIRKFTISNIHSPFEPLREVSQIMYTDWPDFGAPAEAGELLGLVEEVNRTVRGFSEAGKGRKTDEMTPNAIKRAYEEASKLPVGPDEGPIVVHCSAGCGRSGTFVTIDSVCDMLKRQRMVVMSRRNQAQPSKTSLNVPKKGSREAEINPFDVSPTQATAPRSSQMDIDSEESGTSEVDDDDERDLSDQAWVKRDDIDLIEKTVSELRSQRISMVQNLRQFTLCYEAVLEWLVREMPERFRRENFRKSYQG